MKPHAAKASRNRTLCLSDSDVERLRPQLAREPGPGGQTLEKPCTVVWGDCLAVLPKVARASVDLLIADPPYNLTKSFNGSKFKERSPEQYLEWLRTWLSLIEPVLKPRASIYLCCEWRSSGAVQQALEERFYVRNRITWEREKGRGAAHNWKNCSEDIWFCTVSDDYVFNVEAVKQKRKVLAPYRDKLGEPKDWQESEAGAFRLTHPSNLWTDISIPFWSMPENTDHPTQKPEKLIAKLLLASSNVADLVLDPFLGSGTTAAVSYKLGRRCIGIESEEQYCLLAERRIELAAVAPAIQGYSGDASGGQFWDRNTLAEQQRFAAPAAPNRKST